MLHPLAQFDEGSGISSVMLASDDVLNVIGKERLRILRQATVFAAITSPFADSLPEPLVHQAA